MRNFGDMRTGFAKANAQAICPGAAFGNVAEAMPVRQAVLAGKGVAHLAAAGFDSRRNGILVFQYACRRSSLVRSSGFPSGANDNTVNFAGLTLTGYSDNSGAPSAILRR